MPYLSVTFTATDKVSPILKAISNQAEQTKKALKSLKSEVENIGQAGGSASSNINNLKSNLSQVSQTGSSVRSTFSGAANTIGKFASSILNAKSGTSQITGTLTNLSQKLTSTGFGLMSVATNAGKASSGLAKAGTGLMSIGGKLSSFIPVVGQYSTAINVAKTALEVLGKSAKVSLDTVIKGSTESIKLATQLGQKYMEVGSKINDFALKFTGVGEALSTGAQKLGEFTAKMATLGTGFGSSISQMFNMGKATESVTQKVGGLFTSLMNFVKVAVVLRTVNGVINSLQSSVSGALNRLDTFETFDRKMKLITGSSEQAKWAIDEMNNATRGTPYLLTQAATALQNFVTRGMSTKDAAASVQTWMDVVSAYGKGTNEELETVTDAIAKMRTKGTVEMKQLNRLFNVGINPVATYAKAVGRATADVQDDLSNKRISSEEFLSVVEKAFNEGTNGVTVVAGSAKNAATTWAASLTNMGAALTRGMANVISGLELFFGAFNGAGDRGLRQVFVDYGNTMEKLLSTLGSGINTLGTILNQARTYFDAATETLNTFKEALDFESIDNSLAEDLESLADRMKLTISSIDFSEIIPLVSLFRDEIYKLKENAAQTIKVIVESFYKMMEPLIEVGVKVLPMVGTAVIAVANAFISLGRALGGGVLKVLGNVFTSLLSSKDEILVFFYTIYDFFNYLGQQAGKVQVFLNQIARSLRESLDFGDFFNSLTYGIMSVKDNFSMLIKDIDLSSIGTAIGNVVTILGRFINGLMQAASITFSHLINVWNIIFQVISNVTKVIKDNVTSNSSLITILLNGWNTVLSFVELVYEGYLKLSEFVFPPIFDALVYALSQIVNTIDIIFQKFSENSTLSQTEGILMKIGSTISSIIMGLADIASFVLPPIFDVFIMGGQFVIGVFQKLMEAINNSNIIPMLTEIGLLIQQGIDKIKGLFGGLGGVDFNPFSTLVSYLEMIIGVVQRVIEAFVNTGGIIDMVINGILPLFGYLYMVITDMLNNAVIPFAKEGWGALVSVFDALSPVILSVIQTLLVLVDIVATVINYGWRVLNLILSPIFRLVQVIFDAFTTLRQNVAQAFQEMIGPIEGTSDAIGNCQSAFEMAMNGITFTVQIVSWVLHGLVTVIEWVVNLIVGLLTALFKVIAWIIKGIIDFFQNLISYFSGWADSWNSFWKGIHDTFFGWVDPIIEGWNNLVDTIGGMFGTKKAATPKKNKTDFGFKQNNKQANKFSDTLKNIQDSLNGLGDTKGTFNSFVDQFQNPVDTKQQAGEAISAIGDDYEDALGGMTNANDNLANSNNNLAKSADNAAGSVTDLKDATLSALKDEYGDLADFYNTVGNYFNENFPERTILQDGTMQDLENFQNHLNTQMDILDAKTQAKKNAEQSLNEAATTASNAIATSAYDADTDITSDLTGQMDQATDYLTSQSETLASDISDSITNGFNNGLSTGFNNAQDIVNRGVNEISNNILTSVDETYSQVLSKTDTFNNSIYSKCDDLCNTVTDKIQYLTFTICQILDDLKDSCISKTEDMIQSIANTIYDKASLIFDAANYIREGFIASLLGIGSVALPKTNNTNNNRVAGNAQNIMGNYTPNKLINGQNKITSNNTGVKQGGSSVELPASKDYISMTTNNNKGGNTTDNRSFTVNPTYYVQDNAQAKSVNDDLEKRLHNILQQGLRTQAIT